MVTAKQIYCAYNGLPVSDIALILKRRLEKGVKTEEERYLVGALWKLLGKEGRRRFRRNKKYKSSVEFIDRGVLSE